MWIKVRGHPKKDDVYVRASFGSSTMWAIAVAVVDGVIVLLVMSLVGLWVGSQLRIWRAHQDRQQSLTVTRAVWP
jgi:hypothetical protein